MKSGDNTQAKRCGTAHAPRQCGLRFRLAIMFLAALSTTLPAARLLADENRLADQVIDDFQLPDFRGKPHRLADYEGSIVVVAFLGTECPLARLYAPRLSDLEEKFSSRGVAFLAIDSNRQDSMEEIAHFHRTYGLPFPLLRDAANRVADQFQAERTPEVFVLDRERVVRYRGRIDNQYGFHGDGRAFARPEPTQHDLADALVAIFENRPVAIRTTEAPGCKIGRVREPDPSSPVTWSRDIAPIFQKHCQGCHRPGEIAPFPLLSYQDVQGWEETILEVIQLERMPPWSASAEVGQFANDARLSAEEKQQIATWVAHGAPEGDPADLPPPREFAEGWRIGEPDLVLYMSDEPFDVPAEGTVEYQYFVVDPQFTEDRWIQAAECRPGNRAVVHHINVFVLPADQEDFERDDLTNDLLWGFAPGVPPTVLPSGMAIKIEAGTRLVFQLHYTPNGMPQQDRSYMGLRFADADEVRKQVRTVLAVNTKFEIPPYASDHLVESWYDFSRDVLLISLIPHMHLRGKSFRYIAHYPDGTRETLLDVPRYDFNWQNTYVLAEPKELPARTRIQCEARYDNSENNLANPDPSSPVRWGDQTWEEMMIGYLQVAVPREDPTVRVAAEPIPVWPFALLLVCVGGGLMIVVLRWASVHGRVRPPAHAGESAP